MLVETDCTVYIKNGATFERRYIEGVHWEEVEGVNINRTGAHDVDALVVYIPLQSADLPTYTKRKSRNDYIVKGNVEQVITPGNLPDFLKTYDAFTITSIAKNEFGSPNMQHWEVGAR